MVRRVGFGNTGLPVDRKPIAKPEARQPAAAATETADEKKETKGVAKHLFKFVFLVFWITGLSSAIFSSISILFRNSGNIELFSLVWLLFLILFWVSAFKKIINITLGK